MNGLRIDALPTQPQLAPEVAAWVHAQWPRACGGALAPVRRQLLALPEEDGWPCAWVARIGDEPVGTCSVVTEDDPLGDGTLPCLSLLVVPPAWRGRGIGSALCRHAVAEAGRLGASGLFLYTDDAEAFYRARGWSTVTELAVRRRGALGWATFMSYGVQPQDRRDLPGVRIDGFTGSRTRPAGA